MFGRLLLLIAFLIQAGCAGVAAKRTPPPDAELNVADVDVFVEPRPGLFQVTN